MLIHHKLEIWYIPMFSCITSYHTSNNRSLMFSSSIKFSIELSLLSLILPSPLLCFLTKYILRSWYEWFFYKLYYTSGILISHWHVLTTKIGRLCRPVRPVCTNRSDRLRWLCQNTNWTSPLCSSRRDDWNAYVERPIWSSDERVMASGKLDTGSDWSDRSKLHSSSLELYFDTGFV